MRIQTQTHIQMPWNRWMRNLEPVNSSNIHRIVPVNICVMSATAGWRQTNRRIRRGRRRYRDTASSLCALSHALSLARSSLLYPLFLHQVPSARRPPWLVSLSSVLSFSCCFFFSFFLLFCCFGFVLVVNPASLWRTI